MDVPKNNLFGCVVGFNKKSGDNSQVTRQANHQPVAGSVCVMQNFAAGDVGGGFDSSNNHHRQQNVLSNRQKEKNRGEDLVLSSAITSQTMKRKALYLFSDSEDEEIRPPKEAPGLRRREPPKPVPTSEKKEEAGEKSIEYFRNHHLVINIDDQASATLIDELKELNHELLSFCNDLMVKVNILLKQMDEALEIREMIMAKLNKKDANTSIGNEDATVDVEGFSHFESDRDDIDSSSDSSSDSCSDNSLRRDFTVENDTVDGEKDEIDVIDICSLSVTSNDDWSDVSSDSDNFVHSTPSTSRNDFIDKFNDNYSAPDAGSLELDNPPPATWRVASVREKRKCTYRNNSAPDGIYDPDELFCICNDVAYGDMVECDNHCQKEWFHYGCVGISQAPVGEWYCPDCSKKMSRGKK